MTFQLKGILNVLLIDTKIKSGVVNNRAVKKLKSRISSICLRAIFPPDMKQKIKKSIVFVKKL
jgi:hypothetical protein